MQQESTGWAGWAAFAGFMLIMIGVFHAIAGLVEVIDNDALVVTTDYVFKFNAQTWGWIHLIGGVIIFFAGLGVFSGRVWARTVGVIVALISAFANFAWLPYQPLWSLIMITIDIFVIYALTAHGRELAAD